MKGANYTKLMKKYNFALPETVKFEELAQSLVPNYAELSKETQEQVLNVFAITYTCFGGPYFTPPYCPETT
jgi:hypothetical protein